MLTVDRAGCQRVISGVRGSGRVEARSKYPALREPRPPREHRQAARRFGIHKTITDVEELLLAGYECVDDRGVDVGAAFFEDDGLGDVVAEGVLGGIYLTRRGASFYAQRAAWTAGIASRPFAGDEAWPRRPLRPLFSRRPTVCGPPLWRIRGSGGGRRQTWARRQRRKRPRT